MSLAFPTANDALFRELVPYVVAPSFTRPSLDLAPFGLAGTHVIDPLRMGASPFLDRLQRLDALTFGPEGLPMPRWVFYDCAELPAAIFGFARPVRTVHEKTRALFGLSHVDDGLVPYSMYAALPMFRAGHWFGHNLSSLAPVLDDHDPAGPSLKGLGSFTKALGVKVFGVDRLLGATQWASPSLFIHAKFGPLELVTAYTPAHTEPETLTYAVDLDDLRLRATLGDPSVRIERPRPTLELRSDDVAGMRALQDRIEAGERFCITGPPRREGDVNFVPIART